MDTRRSARWLLVGLVVGGALGAQACQSASFACTSSDECESQGAIGVCQPNGYCSFPDAGCLSGQRYGDHAGGGFAGMCVTPSTATGDGTTGGSGEAGDTSGGPGSTSAETSAVDDGPSDDSTTTGEQADSSGAATTSTTNECEVGLLVSDDFADAVIDPMWMQVLESFLGEGPDGLEIFITAGSGDGYPQVRPQPAPWNLEEGFIRIRVASEPKQPGFQLFTSVYGDDGTIAFGVTGGELSAIYVDGASQQTEVGAAPFNSATHRWLQIRFTDNSVYFETSADGVSWDELGQDALPFAVTAVTPTITGGNYSDGENEVAIVDGFEMCAGPGS